jgi:hypothetical protein
MGMRRGKFCSCFRLNFPFLHPFPLKAIRTTAYAVAAAYDRRGFAPAAAVEVVVVFDGGHSNKTAATTRLFPIRSSERL